MNNVLFQEKADEWNETFNDCLKEKKMTQALLASMIQEKCDGSCSQKDVWRWLNVGKEKPDGSLRGFPKYETMVDIAMCLNMDLGHLTGDIKANTYECQNASNYLGLDPKAIEAFKEKTNPEAEETHISYGLLPQDYRSMFNTLFVQEKFMHFIEAFYQLDEAYKSADRGQELWDRLREKYGDEAFNLAIDLYYNGYGAEQGDASSYPENIDEALKDVAEADDTINSNIFYNKDYLFWICRYQLIESLEELISDMYPKIHKPVNLS